MTTILTGDCRALLASLAPDSLHCAITSPPYLGLRAYGTEPQVWGGSDPGCVHDWQAERRPGLTGGTNQNGKTHDPQGPTDRPVPPTASATCRRCRAWRGELGGEPNVDQYVRNLVEVFQAVRRVLRPDGTLWLNLGDSYTSGSRQKSTVDPKLPERAGAARVGTPPGLKEKDLIGVPWRVAFALQADGWTLRSDIIWEKPSAMPESVTDRPTQSHEHVFLFSKQAHYFYDQDAIREAHSTRTTGDPRFGTASGTGRERYSADGLAACPAGMTGAHPNGRNKRSVWSISHGGGYRGAHFAVMPPKLVEPCMLAGTSAYGCCAHCGAPWRRVVERVPMETRSGPKAGGYGQRTTDGLSGTMVSPAQSFTRGWEPTCACPSAPPVPALVLDPFAGSGTVGLVAQRLGRNSLLLELNDEYAALAAARLGLAPEAPEGLYT